MCNSGYFIFLIILIGLTPNVEAAKEKPLLEFVSLLKKVFSTKNSTTNPHYKESYDGVSGCIKYSKLSHGEFESHCNEIAEGETVRVDIGKKESKSNIEQKYILTRNSKNLYEIGFNLMFFEEHRDTTLYTTPELRHEWTKKVIDCFDQVGEIKVGNGKKIKFSFKKNAPIVPIGKSTFKGHRSHSREYNLGIKCPTIIHEVLHLTGLVDEYHEKRYKNRRLSLPSNLMSNQRWAFEDKRGHYVLKNCIKAVNLDKSGRDITHLNEEKKRILDSKRPIRAHSLKVHVPSNSNRKRLEEIESQLSSSKKICKRFGKKELEVNLFEGDYELNEYFPLSGKSLSWYPSNSEKWYVAEKVLREGENSLLREDQLNVILYPGCTEININYYECSKYAYERDPSKTAPEHCLEGNSEAKRIISERYERFNEEVQKRKLKSLCKTDNKLTLWWYNCDKN